MPRQGVWIAILLAACAGAGLVVYEFVLDDSAEHLEGTRKAAEEAAIKRVMRQRPRRQKPKSEPIPDGKPAEEPPEEEGRPISPPDPEAVPGERAELRLELVRPKEDEDRRVVVTVIDEEGVPIEDSLVVFRMGATMVYRERADEEGVAVFDPYEDEEGPFRIDAVADRFAVGTAPDVKPGASTSIVLKMQPWIEGTVKAPSVGNGVVTLYTAHGNRKQAIRNDGSFLFENVEPGWCVVRAEVAPYGSDSSEFELHAGTRRIVKLRVRSRSRVNLYGDIRGWDPAGKAWINGVPVAVSAQGRYVFEKGVYGMNEILIDVPKKALFQERFHVAGRKRHEHNFKLEGEAYIGGRVRGANDGTFVQGAEVRVGVDFDDPINEGQDLFPIERVPIVHTDENGYFRVTRLKRGMQYVISVVKHPYAQFMGNYPAKNFDRNLIGLPTGPFLYGRLHGLGGVPRNATITAYRLLDEPDGRRFNVSRWDKVSSDRNRKGEYGLSGLVPGIYVIRAEAPGYGAAETVVDLREFHRGRMDLRVRKGAYRETEDAELLRRLPPVIEELEGSEDQPRGEMTVLTIDVGRKADKVPLPGVIVRFFEGELEFRAPLSFDEDKFDLLGLPEATYRVRLSHPLLEKPIERGDIKLRRGEPFTVVFREGG
ncbi:MAG: carboxypeptidase-like regulatory domain-containing protein [Planctomycetota bacterium]|jgi:hypothetical protein